MPTVKSVPDCIHCSTPHPHKFFGEVEKCPYDKSLKRPPRDKMVHAASEEK